VVVSQDADSVSLIDLVTMKRLKTLPAGRGPRYVAADPLLNRAYVTNQGDGTITIVDLAALTVSGVIDLGPEARPCAIALLPSRSIALVTQPSKGNDGRVVVVDLIAKTVVASAIANPEKSGGLSDIAIYGTSAVYFANQNGGSVTLAALSLGANVFSSTRTIKTNLGARALAVDVKDKLLLVTNQGSGTISLINLDTNVVVGTINAVRSEDETDGEKHDDREDHGKAGNLPTITSITPATASPNTSFTITVNGTNLRNASGLVFTTGTASNGNHGHGPFGTVDPNITATNIKLDQFGLKLTADITVAAGAAKGDRTVRVLTPNGESKIDKSSANTLTIQ
jgi:DNA-binding beta-propeller fold protein YncE